MSHGQISQSFISFPFSKCDQLDVSRLVSTLIISFSHPSNFSRPHKSHQHWHMQYAITKSWFWNDYLYISTNSIFFSRTRRRAAYLCIKRNVLIPISVCSESSLKVRMTWNPNHVNIFIKNDIQGRKHHIFLIFFLSLTFAHSVNTTNRSPAHMDIARAERHSPGKPRRRRRWPEKPAGCAVLVPELVQQSMRHAAKGVFS